MRLGKYVMLACLCLMGKPVTYGQNYFNQQNNFIKANSVWAWGKFAGLDFNSGSPLPIQTGIISYESCASVADSTGQLLFYLGDDTVFNRNHLPMLNGSGLMPYTFSYSFGTSSQGVLIVPVIDTPWKYYVFKNQHNQTNSPPYLAYSVIDMTLDNGLGAVEQNRKNVVLENNKKLTEAMIAIPGNNCDVWLLSHDNVLNSNDTSYFRTWHITDRGIDPVPVISGWNGERIDGTRAWGGGTLAVSSDRTKIALTGIDGLPAANIGVLLAKFNADSGIVTEGFWINHLSAYGVCFSPDNSKLYNTMPADKMVAQYDISSYNSGLINASAYRFSARSSNGYCHAGLKLYKDTIYASYSSASVINFNNPVSSMARINNPNVSGIACKYEANAIQLLSGTGNLFTSLPNAVVFPLTREDQVKVVKESICYTKSSGYFAKSLSAPAGFNYYRWNDGTSSQRKQITAPGIYWVKYYHDKCQSYIDTFQVAQLDLTISLGEDLSMIFCSNPDAFLQLSVDIPHAQYKWQDGSIANRHKVTAPGVYWVEANIGDCTSSDTVIISDIVFDLGPDISICKGIPMDFILEAPQNVSANMFISWSDGSSGSSLHVSDTGRYWLAIIQPPCVLSDSIYVRRDICECNAQVPNAFSPNSDGNNDQFYPVLEPNCPVDGYLFNIYNRFGERIFNATSVEKGWDGYHRGLPVEVGTYFYEIRFTGGTRKQPFYQKGDVVLVR